MSNEFDRGYLLGNRDGIEFGREQERAETIEWIKNELGLDKGWEYRHNSPAQGSFNPFDVEATLNSALTRGQR